MAAPLLRGGHRHGATAGTAVSPSKGGARGSVRAPRDKASRKAAWASEEQVAEELAAERARRHAEERQQELSYFAIAKAAAVALAAANAGSEAAYDMRYFGLTPTEREGMELAERLLERSGSNPRVGRLAWVVDLLLVLLLPLPLL